MTAPKNKVYVVMIDFTGTSWADACARTSRLDADVQKLAVICKEDVHMHQYADPVGGAPVVLVECSEAFLEKIRQLPLYHASHDLWPQIKTIRRTDAMQIEPPEAMDKPDATDRVKKGPKGPGR